MVEINKKVFCLYLTFKDLIKSSFQSAKTHLSGDGGDERKGGVKRHHCLYQLPWDCWEYLNRNRTEPNKPKFLK